jgi:alginate O-acetyltransferase complex protein AlgI
VVFSSPTFLFVFLPLVLAAYALTPVRLRKGLLVAASLFFYAWGVGGFVFTIVASTLADWALARFIESELRNGRRRRARLLLTASIVQNLALLGYFKYANFFVDQVSGALDRIGLESGGIAAIALPIGISFFTFEKISYTVDVWRGHTPARRNPLDLLLFVSLFPRAIAGPIVRGVTRFAHGLAKKVIIADTVAPVADASFALQGGDLTTTAAWVGIIAYTLQIYFDFSGYSDMAIGLGRIFGFRFAENFNRPYSAVSVTDFWRRWHMTLSRWFRDYLYIPLGGSRGSQTMLYRNLVLVFLATGFWHGADWTFVIWGGYHGALLVVERVAGLRGLDPGVGFVALRRAVTLLLIMVGWVLFRADDIGSAGHYLRAMFTPQGTELGMAYEGVLTNQALFVLALGSLVALMPRGLVVGRALAERETRVAWAGRFAVVGALLPISLVLVLSGTFSAFLYFRF